MVDIVDGSGDPISSRRLRAESMIGVSRPSGSKIFPMGHPKRELLRPVGESSVTDEDVPVRGRMRPEDTHDG